MGAPFLLVENVFSQVQFPAHTIAATEEPAGHEAFRCADGRRSSLDYAGATTANTEWSLTATFNRLRAIDSVFLDRGHNLAGERIVGEISSDAFSTVETLFDITVPLAPGAGALDNGLGVVTTEGAWGIRVPVRAGHAFRLRIPAMGADLTPRVVGLWAGRSWAPPYLGLPVAPNRHELAGELRRNTIAWQARGPTAQLRGGSVTLQLTDLFEYEIARYHVEGHYGAGRPMWLVFDDEQADEALQVIRPEGALGFGREPRVLYPRAEIGYVEHQPRSVA